MGAPNYCITIAALAACSGGPVEVPIPHDAGTGGAGGVQIPPDDAAVADAPAMGNGGAGGEMPLPDPDAGSTNCNPSVGECTSVFDCPPDPANACAYSCDLGPDQKYHCVSHAP